MTGAQSEELDEELSDDDFDGVGVFSDFVSEDVESELESELDPELALVFLLAESFL
jgi:hypothetical protein